MTAAEDIFADDAGNFRIAQVIENQGIAVGLAILGLDDIAAGIGKCIYAAQQVLERIILRTVCQFYLQKFIDIKAPDELFGQGIC